MKYKKTSQQSLLNSSSIERVTEDFLDVQQFKLFGSDIAFSRLVERYQSSLRRYLCHLTNGDSDLADDLSQEIFIKAYQKIRHFSGIGSFRGWLFKMAYNTFLDDRRVRKTFVPIDKISLSYDTESKDDLLYQTLSCLDDTERNIILLSAVEECSHSEITKITGMPLGSVKTVIARAKHKLHKYLEDET